MGFSRQLSVSLTRYLIGNRLRRRKRFPLVLMLEPTFRCNLACAGCGRIREYRDILDKMLPAEECLAAVDESGAPVVSITGGEPLLHPEIDQIINDIIARKKFINLCTNGLLLESSLKKFSPGPYINFVLHMDGLAPTHDKMAGRSGVFDTAVAGIRAARKAGFSVLINTTIYKNTNLEETEKLFKLLSGIPVNGVMVSPAFSYEAVNGDFFLSRQEIVSIFEKIYRMGKQIRFYNTPVYWEFLSGKRELQCTPWSTPTRNPKGWKRPCYLITDGHCGSFRELMETTPWEDYGPGREKRCANCMVHCGFEGSALNEIIKSPSSLWRTIRWSMSDNGRS